MNKTKQTKEINRQTEAEEGGRMQQDKLVSILVRWLREGLGKASIDNAARTGIVKAFYVLS